jgi:2,4-dienoyl-CoA reductase (NADPH2)
VPGRQFDDIRPGRQAVDDEFTPIVGIRRTDEYGGSVENRARFMIEIIKAVRKICKDDFLISVRLNGTELMDEYGGNTDDECIAFMEMTRGRVDLLSMVIELHGREAAPWEDVPMTAGFLSLPKPKKG